MPPASRLRRTSTWSIRGASLTAGIALLLMSVVAIFGNFVAVGGLMTEGNRAKPPQDIRRPRGCSGSASRAWSW